MSGVVSKVAASVAVVADGAVATEIVGGAEFATGVAAVAGFGCVTEVVVVVACS